ncbi:MAG: hypothetical protein SOZ32_05730 [Bacilli bacterium]|nr:hypothetical protein [Mollicutes bacterium]MDY3899680.1 hypothetical protein [Bacilli bacterium]
MKQNKMFILSIVLITVGFIGGGLFAIANSINILAKETSKNPIPADYSICGIILFILLILAIIGMILLICTLFSNKENDKK